MNIMIKEEFFSMCKACEAYKASCEKACENL